MGVPNDACGDTITIIRHLRTADKIQSPNFSPIAPVGGEVENLQLSPFENKLRAVLVQTNDRELYCVSVVGQVNSANFITTSRQLPADKLPHTSSSSFLAKTERSANAGCDQQTPPRCRSCSVVGEINLARLISS